MCSSDLEHRPLARPTWEPVGGRVAIVGDTVPLLRFETNRHLVTINSASTPRGGIDAEVVRLPGGKWQEGLDVTGRIVYADGPPGRIYAEAMRRGAVGVIGYALPAYLKPEINRNSIQFGAIPLDTTRAGWGLLLSYTAHERLKAALARGPVKLHVEIGRAHV